MSVVVRCSLGAREWGELLRVEEWRDFWERATERYLGPGGCRWDQVEWEVEHDPVGWPARLEQRFDLRRALQKPEFEPPRSQARPIPPRRRVRC